MINRKMVAILLLVLLSTIALGYIDLFSPKQPVDVILFKVDIENERGSHQELSNVTHWQIIEMGPLSSTVEVSYITPDHHEKVQSIQYVKSITVISQENATLYLNEK